MSRKQNLKELTEKWNKKLAASGFQDIEQSDGRLKFWTAHFHSINPTQFEAKAEYYRAAGRFLHEHTFKSDVERRIWELHSEGNGIRQITALLKRRGIQIARDTVQLYLKQLVNTMVSECFKKPT